MRQELDPALVEAYVGDIQAFGAEVGAGLLSRRWPEVDDAGLDRNLATELKEAAPWQLEPVGEWKDEKNQVYFRPMPWWPTRLPDQVEECKWEIEHGAKLTGAEPPEPEHAYRQAETIVRRCIELPEIPRPSAPWEDRRGDLVQDGLQKALDRAEGVRSHAEDQASAHVRNLWPRLKETMAAVSQWGRDVAATWSLTREVRKVEKGLAERLGQPYQPQPLPRDPGALQTILREREEASQRAWEVLKQERAAQEARTRLEASQRPSKDDSKGMRR